MDFADFPSFYDSEWLVCYDGNPCVPLFGQLYLDKFHPVAESTRGWCLATNNCEYA